MGESRGVTAPGRTAHKGGRRRLALVLAICGALAAPISAADARVSNRDVRKSLKVAFDYWAAMSVLVHSPAYHCQRGNPEARWHADLGTGMANARRGGCIDEVPIVNLERPTVRRLKDDHACAVITHEFGHLLGYGHNRTKGSIMYNSTDGSLLELLVPPDATWSRAYRKDYCGRF